MGVESEDRAAAGRVARLRELRARSRDDSLGSPIETVRRSVRTLSRAESETARAWEATAGPEDWADRCGFDGVTSGVVRVRAQDQSVKYLAERWLRGGGEAALRAEARVLIKRVKVVV